MIIIASSDGDGSIKQSALPEKYAPSHSHSSSINTVFCLLANQLLLMVMLHPISLFCRKCVLPPYQLALSPQSATPNSSTNDNILQPQLDPLNDSFPHAVESKSLIKKSHITSHLTIPKRLSTQSLLCNCKARCGSKRCPCKINQSLCGESCHPGKKCVNNFSEGEHIFVDLSNADSTETSPLDFATKWVTIDDICLTVWNRKILETENWLNDQIINAAQNLLKKQHGVSGFTRYTFTEN